MWDFVEERVHCEQFLRLAEVTQEVAAGAVVASTVWTNKAFTRLLAANDCIEVAEYNGHH